MENDFPNELVRVVPHEGWRGGWHRFEMEEGGIGRGRAGGGGGLGCEFGSGERV